MHRLVLTAKTLVLCLALAATLSCTNNTTITRAYIDPTAKGRNLQGVLVIGVAREEASRISFEDAYAKALVRHGVRAVASHTVLADQREEPLPRDGRPIPVAGCFVLVHQKRRVVHDDDRVLASSRGQAPSNEPPLRLDGGEDALVGGVREAQVRQYQHLGIDHHELGVRGSEGAEVGSKR